MFVCVCVRGCGCMCAYIYFVAAHVLPKTWLSPTVSEKPPVIGSSEQGTDSLFFPSLQGQKGDQGHHGQPGGDGAKVTLLF